MHEIIWKSRLQSMHEEKNQDLQTQEKNPKGLINSNNEFYSACRHKTKSHRHITAKILSTDEAIYAEKLLQ